MASVTTATSEWIQFFKDAGIPAGLAVTYAVSFVDNRIQKNMLMDLSKELMMDLGITVIGDIIAILKHGKKVYRQDMCKMATEAIVLGQTSVQAELRRTASTPATRMIANALSSDSPPSTPARRQDLSVTVSNKQASKNGKAVVTRPADEGNGLPAVKRRRVTAEMEGKYIVNMPKGTTARTRRILAQQASKGGKRTSVFERLGAESQVEMTTSNSKPTGVFSRLGRADEQEDVLKAGKLHMDVEEEDDSDGDGSVLQYAGVLKGRPAASKKKETAPKPTILQRLKPAAPTMTLRRPAAPTMTLRRLGGKYKLPSSDAPTSSSPPAPEGIPPAKLSVLQRLGKLPATHTTGTDAPDLPADTQDNRVTSTRPKVKARLAVASSKVSSSTTGTAGAGESQGGAQMDIGSISVFKRLGSKRT